MASTTSAFSVLPIVGYVLLAIVLAYIGLRLFRYLKSMARTSGSLPKPVSGAAQKSAFGFGRSTGWDWRRWSLPRVPSWSRFPEVGKGKAKAVANAKNLSVELLPTTGLPPPPTSMPTPLPVSMPIPQLVDLCTPHTPPLTSSATSTSFPTSPRTPSPPFNHHSHQLNTSKPLYPAPAHPAYPRPPSPHALLATTAPPKQHRRSRSLGGVPVRWLSGGTSGLRNTVEMKVMSATQSHVRGTSREHLLIDFTSSGLSDDEDGEGVSKISPAASDIGILPPGKEMPPVVNARMVGRHVPLVDLGNEDEIPLPSKVDEDSWKWFGTELVPSLPYGVRSLLDSRPTDLVSFPQVQKLVDVDGDSHPLEPDSIQVRRTELEVQHHEELVDLSDRKAGVQMDFKEMPLADLHEDYLDAMALGSKEIQLVDIEDHIDSTDRALLLPPPLPSQTSVLVKAVFSHTLDDFVHVDAQPQIPHHPSTPPAVSEKEEPQDGLLFAEAQPEPKLRREQVEESSSLLVDIDDVASEHLASDPNPAEPPSPLIIPMSDTEGSSQGGWAWDDVDVDDPWGNHVADASSPDSEVFIYNGLDAISQPQEENRGESDLIVFEAPTATPVSEETGAQEVFVMEQDLEVLDKSPGGSLFATVLPEEEEEEGEPMPPLDLGGSLDESESELVEVSQPSTLEEEEEEETPKPTPASLTLELPALTMDIPAVQVPIIIVQDSLETESAAEHYADPDLLPLPDSPLLVSEDAQGTEDRVYKEDEPDEKAAPSQTPTPPASPPPISSLRFVGNKSRPPSPGGGMKGMGSMRLPPSPQLAVVVSLPQPSVTVSLADIEDKENETPTALSVGGTATTSKPLWSVRDVDATSLPSSPRLRKRVLVDVSADGNVEDDKEQDEAAIKDGIKQNEKEDEKGQKDQYIHPLKLSSSLPGSFLDSAPSAVVSTSTVITSLSATNSPTTTIAARLALAPNTRQPSARAIVRSPLDIVLAMQLRPGLGAGADPAWMVRFLMAMFGWLTVVVSGGEHF